MIGYDDLIFLQPGKNLVAVGWQGLVQQFEVAGIVKQRQYGVHGHVLHGGQLFERSRLENAPKLFLDLGMVLEFLAVGADPDELDALKLNWPA